MIEDMENGYENVIVVDAGNFLFRRTGLFPTSEEEDKIAAGLVSRGFFEMGYDVVNVGPNDLAAGLDFLTALQHEYSLPLVSANLLSADTFMPAFEPYTIVEIGGVSVGFIGVMGEGASGAHDFDTFIITDPASAAETAIEMIEGQCDLVVLLAAMDRQDVYGLADEVDGIDLIITTSEPQPLPVPMAAGDAVMVSADEKGKRIARVTIRMAADGPADFETEMIPAGSLVPRHREVREIENEFYYWLKEHNPSSVVLDPN
ncbi:MAG: hypothetical protein JW885_16635 [Deltaproteobacteria bacterium]|nr:hypothetical protein [Candidatus Zymogenaceae bacterium]